MTGSGEMPLEVHGDDGVELLFAGVRDHPVPDDAGVVDQHVQTPERVDRRRDEPGRLIPVRDVGPVGDGLPTGGTDFVDDGLRRAAPAGR